MDIKKQLTILWEIYRQDQKIGGNKAKLSRLNRESLEAKEASIKIEEEIAKVSKEKAEALSKRRHLDEKLQEERSKLRKWESRAEKIKGEREYAALMSEIGAQKRAITGIEMEISETMDELKAKEQRLVKASGAHEEKVNSAKKAFQQVKELLEDEEKHLSQNEAVRQKLLDGLPIAVRKKYERIYENRANQGIALLQNGVCMACRRTVPPELFLRVSKRELIEQCPSCQRLVVADTYEASDK